MTTHFRMRFRMDIQSYPHLPEWYQRKMHLQRVSASAATWEGINPSWQYLGM